MGFDEMGKRVHQRPGMILVTCGERIANIISDHPADDLGPMLHMQEIVGKSGGRRLGDMLMLCDCGDLLASETT